jgi:hypothetical protein
MMHVTQQGQPRPVFVLLPEFKAKELLIPLLFLQYSIIKLYPEEGSILW